MIQFLPKLDAVILDPILNRDIPVLFAPLLRVVINGLQERLGIFVELGKLIDTAVQKSQTTKVMSNVELQQKIVFSFFLSIFFLLLVSLTRIVLAASSRSPPLAKCPA